MSTGLTQVTSQGSVPLVDWPWDFDVVEDKQSLGVYLH